MPKVPYTSDNPPARDSNVGGVEPTSSARPCFDGPLPCDALDAGLAEADFDPAKLIEELRVYQAELEVQNAELRESQAIAEVAVGRSRAFFAGLPLAALVIERSGMILEASAEAMRLFLLDGIRGRPRFLASLLDKRSTAQLGEALAAASSNGSSVQHEVVFRTSDNTPFKGELHVARLPTRDAEAMELVCAIVDLTEPLAQAEAIKSAHRALAESEHRYRILADYSLDWDYWVGSDGHYRYVSPACRTLTGYPPEAFLADPDLFRRLLHPDDRMAWDRHHVDTYSPANGSHTKMRLRLIEQSGQTRWVEHQCQAVYDDGTYSGRRGVNRDITARHAAERSAERMSRLYDTLSHSNRAMVRIHDPAAFSMQIARIAVEHGGLVACAIYGFEVDADYLSLLGSHGTDPGCLAGVSLAEDGPEGLLHGLVAAMHGKPARCADCRLGDKTPCAGGESSSQDIGSCVAFPLREQERIVGVIVFYAGDADFFDPQVNGLLEEMAMDVSYTLEHVASEAALAESERHYRLLADHATDMISVHDVESRYLYVSPACRTLLGFDAEALLGKSAYDFIHPEDHALLAAQQRAGLEAGVSAPLPTLRYRLRRADETHIWVETTSRQCRAEAGGELTLVATTRDITERREAEERLRQAARAFESAAEGVTVTDARGNIVSVNLAFTEITGYSEAEVLGQNPRILQSGRHGRAFYEGMWASIGTTGRWCGELWNKRKNGEIYPEWMTIASVYDDVGTLTNYVAVFADISALRESESQLVFLTHHDALTGLPNRVLLRDRLEHAIAHAARARSPLAVLLVDLDRFKTINETLGHPAGDSLLQQVARRLASRIRGGDTLARLGGDEFVVLLEDGVSERRAGVFAANLLSVFAEPLTLDDRKLYVTVSIGISLFSSNGETADDLLRHADTAMYTAKEMGRNTYQYYEPDLTASAFDRLRLENDLRAAVRRGELLVHYQPQIQLSTGRLAGVEALVRWQHPEQGLLAPGCFISVAEEMGIIDEIGVWVLRAACVQMMDWDASGLSVPRVAVNLSAQQLGRDSLVGQVSDILEETGLAPARLELELTESMIMQRADRAIDALRGLRALGIAIAVDDFGTGYSSLGYIRQLPLNRLKIDASFVQDLDAAEDGGMIARAIIGLGKSLGLEVIAEGVEREAQNAFLRREGCDIGQGYLYGRPMPAADLCASWGSSPAG
ncbi:EAL domain-containing protein [Thiocapsa marina]|uniref:cyclic-guanylate-specific phosphodiesterase n=1 Tax=Thiocapsa marina 5811 TaxID=768671 RepID=F9U596_9GAMM|nr:EAL domain-containing protein [Thiocapsa marina]EGV20319.1 diguanylate cyclase/phosphodiesterase with PAS/PAC and GAF sensor(s) [Thiocapsa marina 5811]